MSANIEQIYISSIMKTKYLNNFLNWSSCHIYSFILKQKWESYVADLSGSSVKPHIDHSAPARLHQITIWMSHVNKPKTIFKTAGKGSLAPFTSQQQLDPWPSVEYMESTWGQFYHQAAQTHTWHTCQRGLSQSADPIGLRGLPLGARKNGSSVLHGQLKTEGER